MEGRMQEEIARTEARFRHVFLFFNLSWMVIAIISLIFSAIGAFSTHPQYLHEWRGLAIFGLMLLTLMLFSSPLFSNRKRRQTENCERQSWPPPLKYSFFYWGGMYLIMTLLTLFDNDFVWNYYLVLGLTFALFETRLMLALVVLIFLSYCAFSGFLTWPITDAQFSSILGNAITYTSLTIICFILQHLIEERHERGHLLQQLARSNEELAAAHYRISETAAQEQELAVLRERTRLAREMHDTLGHALVLISVKLEAAQRLRKRDPQRCEQELEATKEIVRESMKDLRASIANLRSPTLEREPACRALSRYAREMAQRAGLRVSYDLHPNIEGLPEEVEETLWKVGQEILTNVEKHAHAQNVLLHISRRHGQVLMRIEDDGVGLPSTLSQTCEKNEADYISPEGHYGLSGMQERVKNIHGQLSIRANNVRGTAVEVILPLVEAPLVTA